MKKAVFFCNKLWGCGGIETFEYYMVKHFYGDPDIEIELWYEHCDKAQYDLMSKYATMVEYKGQEIICDSFFFPSRCLNDNPNLLKNVKAKNIIECFHMVEPTFWNTKTDPLVTKYIAVSDEASKVWKEVTGKECSTYYPIIEVEGKRVKKKDNKLHLISCSRLDTPEKGASRIKVLADRLDELGVDYEWIVYGHLIEDIKNPGFVWKGISLDKEAIFKDISSSDYFIQLSDAEGFCMSIAEALHLNVPIVSTPISVLREHLVDNSNCIVLNFDCSNADEVIDRMIDDGMKFKYEGPSSDWKNLMMN